MPLLVKWTADVQLVYSDLHESSKPIIEAGTLCFTTNASVVPSYFVTSFKLRGWSISVKEAHDIMDGYPSLSVQDFTHL